MKIKLTPTETRALRRLRGLPPNAHMLVMCSEVNFDGTSILEGDRADLDELVEHISIELAEGMLSSSAVNPLADLCNKIDPSCADWLGW